MVRPKRRLKRVLFGNCAWPQVAWHIVCSSLAAAEDGEPRDGRASGVTAADLPREILLPARLVVRESTRGKAIAQ